MILCVLTGSQQTIADRSIELKNRMAYSARYLIDKRHQNLPPLSEPAAERQALDQICQDLLSEYDSESDSWSIITPQLVCDFSGNNFGFQHVAHLAD